MKVPSKLELREALDELYTAYQSGTEIKTELQTFLEDNHTHLSAMHSTNVLTRRPNETGKSYLDDDEFVENIEDE